MWNQQKHDLHAASITINQPLPTSLIRWLYITQKSAWLDKQLSADKNHWIQDDAIKLN